MKFILPFFLSFIPYILICQSGMSYKSKFTILENNEATAKNSITKGIVEYNKESDIMVMDIIFPEKQKWVLMDSTLKKYINDSLTGSQIVKGLQELSIFKELLNVRSTDFGLKSMGFSEKSVEKEENEIFIEWLPAKGYDKFISKANTSVKNNLLQSVIITDIENDDISSIFFEEYKVIDGFPIPTIIKQKVSGQQKNVYKIIKFSDIEIN
jgi:hypothetical protein